jgi:hypothetical protein
MHIINVFPAIGILFALVNASPQTSASPPFSNQSTSCSFWLENISHQGISSFNLDINYTVFRNVKDYGAQGMNILFLLGS